MITFIKHFKILAYLVIIVFSTFSVESFAQTSDTYRPPKGKVREQTRKAGGSRGCRIPLENTVTLLVPQDHTATTISPHPTFFWYLSQKLSLPLRFTLLEPGKEPIFTKELKAESGITVLKLPQNTTPLETGKIYRWTVTIICNDKKPSRNLFAQAWIERVSVVGFHSDIGNISNRLLCSKTYAQMGIWYNALSCAYTNTQQSLQNGSGEKKEFQSLLEQIDLDFINEALSP